MKLQPVLIYAGLGGYKDPEPWGKAISYSAVVHGAILFLLINLSVSTKPILKSVLTEVQFLETREEIQDAMVGGSEGVEGSGNLQLGAPGKAENIESNTHMTNSVPYSSPFGTPNGTVVTAESMSGPIIVDGTVGMIGRKKGSLMPLAGKTEGRKATGPLTEPVGNPSNSKDTPIALSVENIAEIQKRDGGLGSPLIRRDVVGNGTGSGDKLKTLATATLGQPAKLKYEKLKANPLGDDKWGKSKGPFSMEGPLKYRKILKMNLPPYPRWLEEQGMEAMVSIRLWVDPKGRVKENMYLEQASGFAELDQLAKEALKQFVFVQMPETVTQEDEWGVATFKFELKK